MSTAAEIAESIATRITAGELRPGTLVPSTRRIVREHRVAMATASKALRLLHERGLVRAMPGVGTVVAQPHGPSDDAPTGPDELTVDRIVRAAVKVADAEGLRAVSMRRVATEVGVAAMSLYRHVADKEQLLIAMWDRAYADIAVPGSVADDWRSRVRALALAVWALYRRHPWLAETAALTRPEAGHRQLPVAEFALTALSDLRLDRRTTFLVYLTVVGFIHGSAGTLQAEQQAEADSGLDHDAWLAASGTRNRDVIASGAYPESARTFLDPSIAVDLDELFAFGLDRLLDGIAGFAGSRDARDACLTVGTCASSCNE